MFRILAGPVVLLIVTSCIVAVGNPIDHVIPSLERADSLFSMQEFDSAIAVAHDVLRQIDPADPSADSLRIAVLGRLGLFNYKAGDFRASDSLYHDVLRRQIDLFGSSHHEVAMTLNNLGELNYDLGEYDTAIVYLRRSIQTWKDAGITRDPWLAFTINNLGNVHADLGEFAVAESLYAISLEMRRKTLGDKHEDVAQGLNNLALLYHEQGRFDEAEPLYKEALAIWEAALGPNHPDLVSGINNLGYLYSDAARFHLAEPLYERALRIREQVLGPDHPYTATSANNLALHYMDVGRLPEALPLFRQAQETWERELGPDHAKVATVLNNIGSLYQDYGNLPAAMQSYQRALAIRIGALGADHPDVANIIHNLASAYEAEGNLAIAESLYIEGVRIRRSTLGDRHEKVALSLNSLAAVLVQEGQYDSAEVYLREVIDIYREAFGERHVGVATALVNLAETYERCGLVDSALQYHERSLAMRRELLGDLHPEVASGKEAYSRCLRLVGRLDDALRLAVEAFETRLANLHQSLPVLSEPDALTYSTIMRQSAGNYLSTWFALPDSARLDSDDAAAVALSAKGCVTDAMVLRSLSLRMEDDRQLRAIQDSLLHARYQLSRMYVWGLRGDAETYKSQLSTLAARINRLDQDLALGSARYSHAQSTSRVDPDSVRRHLPSECALIDFFRYDYISAAASDSQRPRYAAVVIGAPDICEVIDLADAEAIDALVRALRGKLNTLAAQWPFVVDSDFVAVDTLGRSLYNFVWLPLRGIIQEQKQLYISPDAELHLLSFAILGDRSRYLCEEQPIYYLNAGRDLLRKAEPAPDRKVSVRLALGDPDFSATLPIRLAAADEMTGQESAEAWAGEQYGTRSLLADCRDIFMADVDPLPYTRREVEQVARVWERESGDSVMLLTGVEASEEMLKSIAGKCRMLHLATHGFYAPAHCPSLPAGSLDNPLLSSGLFLAGANTRDSGVASLAEDDGVLTAQEVAGLDLRNCESVVLSACQSGLGETSSGEGVYGLRRAFQMAGAREVVSSLWIIPDRETSSLMVLVYQSPESVVDVLREIALRDIQNARAADKHPLPFTSAAFIATDRH